MQLNLREPGAGSERVTYSCSPFSDEVPNPLACATRASSLPPRNRNSGVCTEAREYFNPRDTALPLLRVAAEESEHENALEAAALLVWRADNNTIACLNAVIDRGEKRNS
jgi:hypothetical protein